MSGIDSFNLKSRRTYRFCVCYNILSGKDDKMPHYYEATYISQKGKFNEIWVFKNFADQETNEMRETQGFKDLWLLHPTFELIKKSERKTKTR